MQAVFFCRIGTLVQAAAHSIPLAGDLTEEENGGMGGAPLPEKFGAAFFWNETEI